MGLDLTQTVATDLLAQAFEDQPDELFEVLAYLASPIRVEGGANWTLLLLDGFVPDLVATKGGRDMMTSVASLLEQMSVALRGAVAAGDAFAAVREGL